MEDSEQDDERADLTGFADRAKARLV